MAKEMDPAEEYHLLQQKQLELRDGLIKKLERQLGDAEGTMLILIQMGVKDKVLEMEQIKLRLDHFIIKGKKGESTRTRAKGPRQFIKDLIVAAGTDGLSAPEIKEKLKGQFEGDAIQVALDNGSKGPKASFSFKDKKYYPKK